MWPASAARAASPGGQCGDDQQALVPCGHRAVAYNRAFVQAPGAASRLPYFAAAMSTNQRIALVAAALAVAVLAFVIAQPGDDDEDGGSATTTPAQTETETGTGADDGATATEEEPPPPPPKPEVTRIRLVGGVPEGGVKDIEVEQGDTVRIVVTADASDDIHLHGYDIEKEAARGRARQLPLQGGHRGRLRDREPHRRGRRP